MSDVHFSRTTPRAESDALFQKSCLLWTTSFWIIVVSACAAPALAIEMLASGHMGVVEPILCAPMTVLFVIGAVKLYRTRARLRRVWRLGERIDVVVRDWSRNYGYWYVTVIETNGRRGVVNVAKMPDEGATLPGLIYGNEIAVLDPGRGVLRPGTLAPRQV